MTKERVIKRNTVKDNTQNIKSIINIGSIGIFSYGQLPSQIVTILFSDTYFWLESYFSSKLEGFTLDRWQKFQLSKECAPRSMLFVDIGCFHPTKYNNTDVYCNKGYRGINIDIDRIKIKRFNWVRKGWHQYCQRSEQSKG